MFKAFRAGQAAIAWLIELITGRRRRTAFECTIEADLWRRDALRQ